MSAIQNAMSKLWPVHGGLINPMSILQVRWGRDPATQVIDGERPITLGHWRLAHVVASETLAALSSGKSGESFACVNLSGRRDRLNPSGATYMRSAVSSPTRDWIVEFVNRPCVQTNPQI